MKRGEIALARMTGAEALIRALEIEGVEFIFGYPGGATLPIYDVLFDSKQIRHILVRHEQCAAHAADGYARSTGKVGVCMATSGPGATNLVTGIANAYMDSVPIVAITGQVATSLIGTDAFQEADITGITSPITKHNYLVKKAEDLPRVVKEAFHITSTGRPGPVLIDVPKDVSLALIDFDYSERLSMPGYKPSYKGHPNQIKQAARKIYESSRPVLYVGGGIIIAEACAELLEFAQLAQIPVTNTLMGKGCFPDHNPLALHMPGMHGTRYANYALTEADLIIAVGVRFDDRATGKLSEFASKAGVIHADIDPAEIGKNVRVDIPIVGDARNILSSLIAAYSKIVEKEGPAERTPWLEQIAEWKRQYPLTYKKLRNQISPEFVVEQLYEATGGDAIVTTGVGQNQMWTAQYWKFKRPRSFCSSGGLGTMGYGLPAAIGAQIGNPGSLVIDIDGDGSIQMVIQELATAVVNRLPIKIAILNNGFLGMVRQWQQFFHDCRYSQTCIPEVPDFVKVAEAYGALGLRATTPEEVRPVIERALQSDLTTVMDFKVYREQNVYPMVAPGKPIAEMIG
ncbi:MAG: Acetolactate synthase large subunit IlvB1 [Actinobacteria bacterium]|nr:Acetolactate synthase large subunit IlvB1 [Actinomycetota bacterium]